jgi:cell wall integrity and stress response component
MRLQRHRHLLSAAIVVAGSAVLLAGCMGLGGGDSSTTSSLRQARVSTTAQSLADASQEPVLVAPTDAYSSFQSKDPFVQQQVATVATGNTSNPTSVTPAITSSTTTTTAPSSGSTTTSSSTSTSTTSTSSSTTSTTSFYSHMLQIYKLDDSSGTAKVTFMVDNTMYTDKVVTDTVSTSWGKVTVVDIDMTTRIVTLLHEDQTVLMKEGQFLFE